MLLKVRDVEMIRHRFNLALFHIGAGMVEYAHLLDPSLTIILFTNNQGFNPYRMTIGVMRFFVPEIEKRK